MDVPAKNNAGESPDPEKKGNEPRTAWNCFGILRRVARLFRDSSSGMPAETIAPAPTPPSPLNNECNPASIDATVRQKEMLKAILIGQRVLAFRQKILGVVGNKNLSEVTMKELQEKLSAYAEFLNVYSGENSKDLLDTLQPVIKRGLRALEEMGMGNTETDLAAYGRRQSDGPMDTIVGK